MAGRELKALFKAHRQGDELAFRRAAQEIVEEEEAKNHLALARDLRALLVGGSRSSTIAPSIALPEPPKDREDQWPLAQIKHAERNFDDLVLSGTLIERLRTLTEEYRRWQEIDRKGIPRRQRILFYGPPGCGKTSAAEAIATEIGLPLVIVRIDAVVSSYLGETASNLHRIFDFVAQGSWVLLFDEFDALGRARDDPSEHGEIKRVITAFLQMLDAFCGSSLLIAATNHEHLLDPALWRRFDDVLGFPRATVHQNRKLLRQRLRAIKHQGLDIESSASILKGKPHAAVEKVAWDAVRFAVLADREVVEQHDLDRAIKETLARPW